ncbi:MAG TPA: Crp/Fnr family transcriptional regulator, partial [Ramlibacter sp.]|nr:Crp/Fnr family transcriptional regulator [Ramlibacter sp.]
MDELHQLAAQMQRVLHFRNMSPLDLLHVASAGQIRRFRKGETILGEGDACDGMHVLLRGNVQLRKAGPQGQTGILAVIRPVIMFNEVALLDGGPNPCSAHASADSTTWQIGPQAFQGLLERYPQLGLSLLSVLARRNRQMIARYEDVSFRPVMARVSKLLL